MKLNKLSISKKGIAKVSGIAVVAFLALYGAQQGCLATVRAVNAKLDSYSVNRVVRRDLVKQNPEIVKEIVKEVPVTLGSPEDISDKVDEQINAAIDSRLK